MGSFSLWHWVIVGAIVLLLFGGKGKLAGLMEDLAKGIKSFKKAMSEEEKPVPPPPIEPPSHSPSKEEEHMHGGKNG